MIRRLLVAVVVLASVLAALIAASSNDSPMATTTGESRQCEWQIGDDYKMHFPQLPDEYGWDVNATEPMVLADDWMCSQTGCVEDIHFWGSWRSDDTGQVLSFIMAIHENIPADPPSIPFSRPGMTLWEAEISDFTVELIDPPSMEGWYDPATGEVITDDHGTYYQYNVCLDSSLWFWQEEGTIYWLSISAVVDNPARRWGWKNSNYHWMDDATWGYLGEWNWQEIYEPSYDVVRNDFWIEFGDNGTPIDAGGSDYYDDGTSYNGWFHYPNTDWWNIWFYDHPFDPNGYKLFDIYFEWYPTDPYYWIEVAANWSTPDWPSGNPPPVPPLTPAEENLYIEREYLELYPPGMQHFGVYIPDYCPEWVSIDFMGQNFIIQGGYALHDCVSSSDSLSLDLAFVITGDDTCYFQDPGDANGDGVLNIQDIIHLIDYVTQSGPAPQPLQANGDPNGDCCIDWQDIRYLTRSIFMGGPPPVDCTCIDPPICIAPPPPHTDGAAKHSYDGYHPPDGDPTGTQWHELHPAYCKTWTIQYWRDNGDGILSFCDALMSVSSYPADTIWEHVELVTTTLGLVSPSDPADTMYVDLIDPPNPLDTVIIDPFGTIWHEVYPDYCLKYQAIFSTNYLMGLPLAVGDQLFLQALNGPDSATGAAWDVFSLETDIVTTETSCCIPPIRGNVDYDALDAVNIVDLTYLTAYLFGGGPEPICRDEGNVEGDVGNIINIVDLTYLVQYLFGSGPQPAPCP